MNKLMQRRRKRKTSRCRTTFKAKCTQRRNSRMTATKKANRKKQIKRWVKSIKKRRNKT